MIPLQYMHESVLSKRSRRFAIRFILLELLELGFQAQLLVPFHLTPFGRFAHTHFPKGEVWSSGQCAPYS